MGNVHENQLNNLYFGIIEPISKIYMATHLHMLRVVFGGDYTVLIDKTTRKKICQVKRDKSVKNDLTKAVLYLLLKSEGVYGKEIQTYFDRDCITYYGTLEYLLEFGAKANYTKKDIKAYRNMISSEDDPEVGFLYMLLYDRFGVEHNQVVDLVANASCSETDKTKLRMLKKRKIQKHSKVRKKAETKSREELEKL